MAWNYNNYNNSDDNNELVYDLRQTYAKLLEEILLRIAECRVQKNFVGWFNALDDLHTEISQKFDKDEKVNYEKELLICVTLLNKYPAAYNKQSSNVQQQFEVKSALKNLELWLKEMMEKKHMYGAKDMEDDGL